MRRAFVDPAVLSRAEPGQTLALDGDAAHHLARVLRLPEGHPVELFDGTGRVAGGTFSPGPPPVVRELVVEERDDGLPPLVVAQALVRPAKLEEVVRRATELGASSVLLFEAARSKPGRFDDKKRTRLERVALDAVRQSERVTRPALEGPLTRDELLERIQDFPGLVVLGVVDSDAPLSTLLSTRGAERGLCVVVGPEGGLDDAEVASLVAAGALPCRLGAHVLRTETAALVALAAGQAALGRL